MRLDKQLVLPNADHVQPVDTQLMDGNGMNMPPRMLSILNLWMRRAGGLLRDVRVHQYCHLILVFLVVFLYLTARKVAGQGAGHVGNLQSTIEIAGTAWVAWIGTLTVRHGLGFNLPQRILEVYRARLARLRNVFVLNGVLCIACAFLGYHLLFFRDVTVVSNRNAELIPHAEAGGLNNIVSLDNKTAVIRLRVGQHRLVARDGDQLAASKPFNVTPFWQADETGKVSIHFADEIYEETRSN